jgi:hypothetical protein
VSGVSFSRSENCFTLTTSWPSPLSLAGSHIGVNNTFEVAQSHAGFSKLDITSEEYRLFQEEKQTFTVRVFDFTA